MTGLERLFPVSSFNVPKNERTYSSKEHKLGNVTISLMFSDQIIGVGIDKIETWTSTLHNHGRCEQ